MIFSDDPYRTVFLLSLSKHTVHCGEIYTCVFLQLLAYLWVTVSLMLGFSLKWSNLNKVSPLEVKGESNIKASVPKANLKRQADKLPLQCPLLPTHLLN